MIEEAEIGIEAGSYVANCFPLYRLEHTFASAASTESSFEC